MNCLVVLSGCSGGGKSTLLAELARRCYSVIEGPGRRIVREETSRNGSALPWVDAVAFLRRAIALSIDDLNSAPGLEGSVFFDRGMVDAAAGLQHLTGKNVLESFSQTHRYHRRVFLAPPWPELFQTDPERRHSFDSAVEEYSRLLRVYPALGYEITLLPKSSVAERADFILNTLTQ